MSDDKFLAELKIDFLNEASFMMEQYEESMLALETSHEPQVHIGRIFRVAHSLKGGGTAVGFEDLSHFAHKVEDLLSILRTQPEKINTEIVTLLLEVGDQFKLRISQLQSGKDAIWSVVDIENQLFDCIAKLKLQVAPAEPLAVVASRVASIDTSLLKVDSLRVDAVLKVVDDIVILKNQLLQSEVVKKGDDQQLALIVNKLDKLIRDLYTKTLGIRMTPLRSLFTKIQRTVRDISLKLNKPVHLELIGEDTEVDRSVFELLGDPLIHMVRNAMDHGIETKEERIQSGKPEVANFKIEARQEGAAIVIEISEDGRGIQRERVIKKAIEKGLVPFHVNVEKLSDEQVYQFLFVPGFSTADKITELSGRGVGLDVVKFNIEKANGVIRVKSTPGKGSTFEIQIPLSATITDGIVVAIGVQAYMIPLYAIKEIVQVRDNEVTGSSRIGKSLNINNKFIPVIDFEHAHFEAPKAKKKKSKNAKTFNEQKIYMILELTNGLSALQVDEVRGQSQVVAKPLQFDPGHKAISGQATLGDGHILLIFDPYILVQKKASAA